MRAGVSGPRSHELSGVASLHDEARSEPPRRLFHRFESGKFF
jgi:hypothetical protein